MNYQTFITQTLKQTSAIALKHFGHVSGKIKPGDSNQVLTKADLTVGKTIITAIGKTYPDHNVIDEEAGVIDKHSDYTWVVDPIDGTSNFAVGIPLYGIIIGLLKGGTPIAGGIALPASREICIAEKGKGAWCNGKRMRVTREKKLLSTLVAYGIDSHREQPTLTRQECTFLAEIVLKIRNLRSTGSMFDAIMVAKGKYGACLSRQSKIWDNIGTQSIIEEAGGLYTDFFGKPQYYHNPLKRSRQTFTICMAAPTIHKQLQKIIRGMR